MQWIALDSSTLNSRKSMDSVMSKEMDISGKSVNVEGGECPPYVMLTQTGVFLFCAQNLRRNVDALLNTRSLIKPSTW